MTGASVVVVVGPGGDGGDGVVPPQALGAARWNDYHFGNKSEKDFLYTCHTPVVSSNLIVPSQIISFAARRPLLWNSAITHQTLAIASTTISTMFIIKIMKHSHVVAHFMSNNLSTYIFL